jgi:hypothetical protein
VALAEKAYVEANAVGIVTSNNVGIRSYDALNNGDPAWALQAITGKSASDYSINPSMVMTSRHACSPAIPHDWPQRSPTMSSMPTLAGLRSPSQAASATASTRQLDDLPNEILRLYLRGQMTVGYGGGKGFQC